jgi:hypothetical protein
LEQRARLSIRARVPDFQRRAGQSPALMPAPVAAIRGTD